MIEYRELSNGVKMPSIVMGTSLCDRKGNKKSLYRLLEQAVKTAIVHHVRAFDTARDYQNEELLGQVFKQALKAGEISREDLFITTKVGNAQQAGKNMEKELEQSLRSLQLDYLDLWLLHWPCPDYYIDNWKQLEKIYQLGRVRAIGICNCRERHLDRFLQPDIQVKPHVVQVEYHPFRTIPGFVEKCRDANIQLEAYSALCNMLPMVKENALLNQLSGKYHKNISQIILRWHLQQGSIPIFSSLNADRIRLNTDVFDFVLDEPDRMQISALNMDYKFHPESMNCPGY